MDVSDVTILLNALLNDTTTAAMDLDGDGKVDVSDVTVLINFVLG